MSDISSVQAIDVHAHYGVFQQDQGNNLRCQFSSGDATTVVRRAAQVNVAWSIVSPLLAMMPRPSANAVAGNEEAVKTVAETDGLLQWVVIHPHQEQTYQQAEEMFQQAKCVGIKIHPEEHAYHIRYHGRKIFEFAARHQAVILTHSGQVNSLPNDFVPFANDFPEVTLILAHLGNADDGDPTTQVRAIQAGKHDNLYVDTSSATSILPQLIEWAVTEVGAAKILFGTDTPLYSTAMQRFRIDTAEISDTDKRAILRDNAIRAVRLEKVIESAESGMPVSV